ncbi:MAG: hypothetical protein EA352_04795 [Gemmatimonadales bacterium]|nr:MAG: hypothetical protein EA352_04795 [Gemmatimonadales bacterium]
MASAEPAPGRTPALPEVFGHVDARQALAAAARDGRLPRSLLLRGPRGVGKQRLAHWTAQLLLCADPGPSGPCEACRECRLVRRIEHPGVHWTIPLEKPKSRGSAERNEEALEDARIRWIEEARTRPWRASHQEGMRALHLGTIRNLRRRILRGGSGAGPRVFIVSDAEELVVQEASQEAANALLKVLEEPPEDVWIILTSSQPGRLLDTIRSRCTALHLSPLPLDETARILREEVGVDDDEALRAARLSGGAPGVALGFVEGWSDADGMGPLEALRRDSFHLLRASLSDGDGARFRKAVDYPAFGGRGLLDLLAFLELWLRDLAAVMAGNPDRVRNTDALEWLERQGRSGRLHPAGPSRSLVALEDARTRAQGNVNPQLLVLGLLRQLNRTLVVPSGPALPDAD